MPSAQVPGGTSSEPVKMSDVRHNDAPDTKGEALTSAHARASGVSQRELALSVVVLL